MVHPAEAVLDTLVALVELHLAERETQTEVPSYWNEALSSLAAPVALEEEQQKMAEFELFLGIVLNVLLE